MEERSAMQVATAVVSQRQPPTAYLPCWCGAGEWRTFLRNPRFGLLHCFGCDGYRIDPPPLRREMDSGAFYTDYYSAAAAPNGKATHSTWRRECHFWEVAARVSDLKQPGGNVLEIGCGDGNLCCELLGAGWRAVTGLDISRARIALAHERYPGVKFFDCPLEQSGLPPASFDMVVMEAVVEHLVNPRTALQEIRNYLRPGGRLVLTTPNMASGHFRFLRQRWSGMLAPHVHIFLFNATAISHLLRLAGFEVEAVGSYHRPLFTPLQFARRLGRGDLKGAVWRAHQEIGALYGRLVGQGPMLYAVGRRSTEGTLGSQQ